MKTEPVGLLFDMSRCAGCHKCVAACMDIHGFKGDPETVTDLSATAYTSMVEKDEGSIRNLCRHCVSPSCASVCPVGALQKTELGPVIYDVDRCIGCRYCMVACPFNIPRYEWDSPVPAVRKCDMCIDRLQAGEKPACVEACEYEATVFGPRSKLLALARERIEEDPDEYYDHIYGETEIGGTSVLFLTPKPEESLGYKAILGTEPLPGLTLKQLDRVPSIVVGGGAALMAIWWITNRRDEVAAVEGPPRSHRAKNGNGKEDRHEWN
jgi:formate dehydrogenase iron-sulfur subunit